MMRAMMSNMRISHPCNEAEFKARDELLQAALRDEPTNYDIASEYPLVLCRSSANFSWCGFIGSDLVAHVNLWPRRVQGRNIGVIGNVATASEFRGRGIMRTMFETIKKVANQKGLSALLLWSDLQEFYQKLGFRSCSQERRYLFVAPALKNFSGSLKLTPAHPECAAQLLPRRYFTRQTLDRDVWEMQKQLSIPETHAFQFDGGYIVEGRGSDLRQIVHEWGAVSPEDLLAALSSLMQLRGLDHIMLLSPKEISSSWDRVLSHNAESVTIHPMALVDSDGFDDLFVWGLDSI